MIGEGPRRGGPRPGLAATTTVPDAALHLEGLARLEGARTLIDYILVGHVTAQPWAGAARQLVEKAEFFFEKGVAA